MEQTGSCSCADGPCNRAGLGSEATFNAQRDLAKRPRFPRRPFLEDLVNPEPQVEFCLDEVQFSRNLRSAMMGRSWETFRHDSDLQPLLSHAWDLRNFIRAGEQLSRARVTRSIRKAIRLERLKSLQKPNGGVRTMSQQLMFEVHDATVPRRRRKAVRASQFCKV